MTFRRDARFLRFAHPRLVVEADWMSADREFGVVWTEGAIVLSGIGLFLVLVAGIRGTRRAYRA